MASMDTGPARSVLTTPIGGVAQAYLKAITPIVQLKQSAPSISLTVLFFIVVDPFLTRNRVEMAGEIPPDVEASGLPTRLVRSAVTSRQSRCFVNSVVAPREGSRVREIYGRASLRYNAMATH